jgi:hypothetical protein
VNDGSDRSLRNCMAVLGRIAATSLMQFWLTDGRYVASMRLNFDFRA